jgi:hypothetical protein
MKFDLPEPFGPISKLMGVRASFSIDAMLLNPFIVMWSRALDTISSNWRPSSPKETGHQVSMTAGAIIQLRVALKSALADKESGCGSKRSDVYG